MLVFVSIIYIYTHVYHTAIYLYAVSSCIYDSASVWVCLNIGYPQNHLSCEHMFLSNGQQKWCISHFQAHSDSPADWGQRSWPPMLGKCVLVWHICTTITSSIASAGYFLGARVRAGGSGIRCVFLMLFGSSSRWCLWTVTSHWRLLACTHDSSFRYNISEDGYWCPRAKWRVSWIRSQGCCYCICCFLAASYFPQWFGSRARSQT